MAHTILSPTSQFILKNEKKNGNKNPTFKMSAWSTWFYACDKIAHNFTLWVNKKKCENSNKCSKAGSY